jgi:hypothetical protein
MNKISEQLIQLSDKLDSAGKPKCANAIDQLIEHQSLTKVAQYVGAIGYVLKQNRAMGNCIRKKRASSSVSMQEIVLGCLSEYQDGQQYENTEWTSKYAQVVKQCPDQFESAHIDFIEALAEENDMYNHVTRVKQAQNMLVQEEIQDDLISKVASDLENLERILEGDADHRPFKLAAPPSNRGLWSKLWANPWRPRGKDADTRFEMDGVLESLVNIQKSIQQIRGGISKMRYDSRSIQDPKIHKDIQSLSDTNWDNTTNGIHKLKKSLGTLNVNDPLNETTTKLVESTRRVEKSVEQIFKEIESVQKNMYNLRQRDPVKGRGSQKSATEEYGDLSQTLDRLYINPLDERALHYSLKLHGRLEDTLNERAGAQDPGFGDWINSPESQLGKSRQPFSNLDDTDPDGINAPTNAPTNIPSNIESSLMAVAKDPNVVASLIHALEQVKLQPKDPETGEGINVLLSYLQNTPVTAPAVPDTTQADPINFGTPGAAPSAPAPINFGDTPGEPKYRSISGTPNASTPSSNVVSTNVAEPFDMGKVHTPAGKVNWGYAAQHAGGGLKEQAYPKTAKLTSTLQKLTKVADSLHGWNDDLSKLLKDYIEEEEHKLPDFPSSSSIIKEHEYSEPNLREKNAGAVALST